MRIVGGQFRGRALGAPADREIRPTSDRVREAIFNVLSHGIDEFEITGRAVIDLFAGTGALGLEALSRGASYCLFVEQDAAARGLVRTNIDGLGLGGITRIFRRDATDLGPCTHPGAFGLAFLDPPYGKALADAALRGLVDGGWLAPGCIVVVEERAGAPIAIPDRLTLLDQRSYGDTAVHFLRSA